MLLAFLRPEDIPIGLQEILTDSTELFVQYPRLNDFMRYFNSQWMSSIEQWSVSHIEDHTTNNDQEGWHSGTNSKLETRQHKKLSLWKFMEAIGKIALHEHQIYIKVSQGQQVVTRSRRSVTHEANITRMRALYLNDQIYPNGTREQNISRYIHGLLLSY